jgi:hypothetical protein
MSSLIKFVQQRQSKRGPVYWNRASQDGLPYRGQVDSLRREEEFEATSVRVRDPDNGTFNTADPEQNEKYLYVMDRIVNNWYTLLHIERWRNTEANGMMIYMEWVEQYLEDGTNFNPEGPMTNGN